MWYNHLLDEKTGKYVSPCTAQRTIPQDKKKQSIILFKYSATGMFLVAILSFPTFRGFRYPGKFLLVES